MCTVKTACLTGVTLVALVLLAAGPSKAQVYKWVDKKGTVHFTDNPDDLPEPQRSEALRKLDVTKKKKKKETAPVPVTPSADLPNEQLPPDPGTGPDRSAERKRKKKVWQSKVLRARRKVDELSKKCKELEAKKNKSSRDSLIFARPGDRKTAKDTTAETDKCKKSLKNAIYHLEVELPEQARKEKVPPGWLR
jgi:hypothetical protein